jgi:hypothetical protein
MLAKHGRIVGMAMAFALLGSHVADAQLLSVPVEGNLTNRPGRVIGSVEGVLDIVEFVVEDGELLANGILNADVINRGGRVITTLVDQAVSLPVTDLEGLEVDGVCQILNLTLGPLDLNVLGLIVELDTVNLDISADPAGGLLGDLLCSLAGGLGLNLGDLLSGLDIGSIVALLDLTGLLQDVLDILNSIGG